MNCLFEIPCLLGLEKLVADELKKLKLSEVGRKTAASCAGAVWRTSRG